jgi:excisionase family DNA binding protein
MPASALPAPHPATAELDGDRIDATIAKAIVGLNEGEFYRACSEGLIPHWRVGRRLRFSRRALEQFVADGGTNSTAAPAHAA